MSVLTADAVVVGGGHHGLVAAALLADAGWDVCLLEATDRVGGAVRSAELHPGFTADLFSAFYPLYAASPVLQALDLGAHGLRVSHAPVVLAHPPRPDGERAALLFRDPEATAARLAEEHARDGDAWLELCRQWDAIGDAVLRTLFTTFPPVRGPIALLRAIGTAEALRLARFLLLPAKRMGEELFAGEGARLLLAGNAAHADAPVDAPVSGAFGWLLAMLGQKHGFPVPVGGAGELTAALERRAQAAGAAVHCGQPVERIDVRGGRAVAVHTSGGLTVRARRAVIVDVNAPAAVPGTAACGRRAGPPAARPGQVRVGHPGRQGQLGARRPDPLARRRRRRCAGRCISVRTSSGSSGGRRTWSRGRCPRRRSCCSAR